MIELNPLVRPVGDCANRLGERPPLLRQRVFNADGRVGHDRPLDDPFGLELLQAIAEHAIGDVGNRIPQRGEPAGSLEEHEDDGARPPPPDQFAGTVEAWTELRGTRSRTRHLPIG